MGFQSIISRPKKKLTELRRVIDNKPVSIFLDATVKEAFTATAELTKHPVEDGADIADHIIIKPQGLQVSGIVTQTPFPSALAGLLTGVGSTVASSVGSKLGAFGGAVGALAGAQGGSSLAGSVFKSKNRNLADVAAEFVAIRDAKQPVSIQTGLRLYEDYVLTAISINKTDKDGGQIAVDLTFEEFITVDSELTDVPIPKVKGAVGKANQGHQSKDHLSTDEGNTKSSLLKKIGHGIFGG